jgi:protein-disulfide isomerase
VLEKFPKDVKIVIKNFPLPMHKQAQPAALASLAAHRQGKYWPYHDKLMENSAKLSDDYYVELAKELKLDVEKFKADLKDPSLQALIAKDMADGQAAGVGGTPTIFVNGVRLENRSDEGFESAVQEALKTTKK